MAIINEFIKGRDEWLRNGIAAVDSVEVALVVERFTQGTISA